MKTIPTTEAVGAILCHDLTRIVKDQVKEAKFRKGHVVRAEDIPVLLSMGKKNLFVWDLGEDMVHENEAAEILKEICLGPGLTPTPVKEGRISLMAEIPGLFVADEAKVRQINGLGEISVASRHSGFEVVPGQMSAAFKIIPLATRRDKLEKAQAIGAGRPLFEVKPYYPLTVGIVATGHEIYTGLIKDTFTPVVKQKVEKFGLTVVFETIVDDQLAEISGAINRLRAKNVDLIICTGGMSVDPDDLTPGAIKAAGAELVCYGTPVFPGAMFLVAYLDNKPVLGLPGCVMFERRTIFDVLLPRIAAKVRITPQEIQDLGLGGLCLNCLECVFPNCGFGKGPTYWPGSLDN
ncbi:MAG: molybdopterin-binding protein [Deltaproteobacteria bacterium]|jgi:molybdenum cofactor synthesis domain-containing protein|nr:molybdopterin-binding protein [Deltaproteobacteria bacterium]